CFRFLPQLKNFQLTDHIGTCLTGVHHVALDLGSLDAVIDRLLSGPTFCVKAGIDNESASAKLLPIELPQQAFEIIVVPSRFRSQMLGIESPSLDTCGAAAKDAQLSKCWQVFVLNPQSKIEVMAWHSLMVDDAAQPNFCHPFFAERKLKDTGTRAIGRRGRIVGCSICLTEARKGLGDDGRSRSFIEKQSRSFFSIPQDELDIAHDQVAALVRCGVRIGRIPAKLLDPILYGAFGAA